MATERMGVSDARRVARAGLVRLVAGWIVMPLFFLVTGGDLGWWQAWAWCAVLLVPMTLFVTWMMARDPEFLVRRMKMREKERAQRRVLTWGVPLMLAELIIPGLDHRWGWSEPPLGAVVAALALVLSGYLGILAVFLANRWAGRTIETYDEQEVVTTGPYAVVRHPMYTATTVLYLATPVALGSWWAVLPALAFIPLMVLRIRNEEEVLVRELEGYPEYRRKVRHRLIPYVW
jgi:protein-S-isoprenylcysteine O-methyltransferase Ste14